MTKSQAILAMRSGEKVRHETFSENEWISVRWMNGSEIYEFEDKNICSKNEFWAYRKNQRWEDGWEVVI